MKGVVGMMQKPIRGQGALEYLLLIGGAVLVGTVVLLIAIGSTSSTTGIINDNIDVYEGSVSLHTFDFGGGSPGTCTPSATLFCTTGSFSYPGTQTCNASGTAWGSCTTTFSCGDNSIDGTEVCDTGGNQGCSGGTPVCNACSVCVASGSDTTPPVFSTILVTPGNSQATVDFLATDPTGPVNYSLGYATTASGAISTYTTTSNGVGVTVIPGPVSPQVLSGLTNGVSYDVVVRACDSATPVNNCALTAIQLVTPNPPLPYITAFSVTPLASTLGYANYSFNWTANPPLPASYTEPIGGILSLTNAFIPNGTFVGNDAAYAGADAYINRNPASGSAPAFTLSSGNATGKLSAQAIKATIEALGGNGPYFVPIAESSSVAGAMYAVGDAFLGSYPSDTDPPESTTLNGSTSTGFNGGAINVNYVNPSDWYLGQPYITAVLNWPNTATVAYSNSPIASGTGAAVTAFDAIAASAKKTILPAPVGTLMSDVLNYNQGIIPSSSSNYIGVKICDVGDGLTSTPAGSSVNCRIISAGPFTSSKEAQLWEAESFNLGNPANGLTTGTYSGENVLISAPGCVPANANVQKDITFLAPASPNTTYRVWVRAANTNPTLGNRQTIRIKSGTPQAAVQFVSSGASTALAWQPTTVQTMALPGGLVTFTLQQTNTAGTIDACNADLKVDKILLTSQQSCTPTGDGSNCI